jgi:hypothetical protein
MLYRDARPAFPRLAAGNAAIDEGRAMAEITVPGSPRNGVSSRGSGP